MGIPKNSMRQACYAQSITKSTLEALEGINGRGSTHFLDTINGSNSKSGKSWDEAFATMTYAMTQLTSGDTLVCAGKCEEQVTTPVGVFDVTVIGVGNRPRHADSSPAGGQRGAFSWTEPGTEVAQAPLVDVIQQGWRFENILFYSGDDNACIRLSRTAEGADETDASHLTVRNCRFASGYNGISDVGGCYGVLIEDCRFGAFTNFCILGVGNIGAGQGNWIVRNNHFYAFTNGVKCAFFDSRVEGNTFNDGGTPNTTVVLNTVNGTSANNFIINNFFQTTTANFNTPDVEGNATDVWFNNSIDGQTSMIGHELGTPA